MIPRTTTTSVPIRLAAIATGPAPTKMPPAKATDADGIFADQSFTPIEIVSRLKDHVIARHGGTTTDYAVGHLPASLQAELAPRSRHDARFADAARRTVLGILSQNAIDDIHDEDPMICPVTLNVILALAADPSATIAAYRRVALRIGRVDGREQGRDGSPLTYTSSQRRLHARIIRNTYSLDVDTLTVLQDIPETMRVAAVGRRMSAIVDHHMFRDTDAVATAVQTTTNGVGIRIEFTATAVRLAENEGIT